MTPKTRLVESPMGPVQIRKTVRSDKASEFYLELQGSTSKDLIENAIVVVSTYALSTTKTSQKRHLQNALIDWFVVNFVRKSPFGRYYVKF